MSRASGPPADPAEHGTANPPGERMPEPYQRPNPETIEDAEELRASVERVIRRAGVRFREEQQELVEVGLVDGEGRLLRSASFQDAAAGTRDVDR